MQHQSLMSQYFKEFIGDETIENSFGFATYRYLGKDQVYIVHIYVSPERRYEGLASKIADRVAEIARQRGCKEILGSVVPTAPHATESLRVLLGYGMKLKNIQDGMIIFSKEIK